MWFDKDPEEESFAAGWLFVVLVLLLAAAAVYTWVPLYNPAWGML